MYIYLSERAKPLMNTTLREAETVISAFDYKM